MGCVLLILGAGCKPAAPPAASPPSPSAAPTTGAAEKLTPGWKVTSTAFADGARIPVKYTQDGAGVSPPLAWTLVPTAAKELVLICDDPDAPQGTFTHWVAYGLDPGVSRLPEALATDPAIAEPGLKQGMNSGHHVGYLGPLPPPGKIHHYHFQLFAVSVKLNLTPSVSKEDVVTAMDGKIVGQAELVGTYSK